VKDEHGQCPIFLVVRRRSMRFPVQGQFAKDGRADYDDTVVMGLESARPEGEGFSLVHLSRGVDGRRGRLLYPRFLGLARCVCQLLTPGRN
jgi:hypothetical protein